MKKHELIEIYNKIYSAKKVVHPTRGELEPYGASESRDKFFIDYLQENFPPPGKVLDASCGRGHLLRKLLGLGYEAEGTEVPPCLFEPGSDIEGLKVQRLAYDELSNLGTKVFDVVISNDVLEHMANEDQVNLALLNLCFVSKQLVLISTGIRSAPKYPLSLGLGKMDLHQVLRGPIWWSDTVNRYVNVEYEHTTKHTWFGFGTVRA